MIWEATNIHRVWRNREGKAGELCKSSRVLIDKPLACFCLRVYVLVLYVGVRLEWICQSVAPYAPQSYLISLYSQGQRSHNQITKTGARHRIFKGSLLYAQSAGAESSTSKQGRLHPPTTSRCKHDDSRSQEREPVSTLDG